MIKFESEAALERCFVNHYEETGQDPIGKDDWDHLYQQPEFGGYGRGDLLYQSADFILDENDEEQFIDKVKIVELKNETLKVQHVAQIARYYQFLKEEDLVHSIDAVLVAPDIDLSGDIAFLIQQIDWLDVFTFSISFDGIKFNKIEGYKPSKDNWPSSLAEINSADFFEFSL